MIIILASPLISKAGPATPGSGPKASEADSIEARINSFHSKLKITEAQKEQWDKLAQVMRENAATMDPLVQERKEKGKLSKRSLDLPFIPVLSPPR